MRKLQCVGWLAVAGLLVAARPGGVRAEKLYRVDMVYQVQTDSVRNRWTDVDDNRLELKAGMSGTAFLGDASINIVVATAGSYQYLVDFTLTTLPPSARVVSRQLLIEHRRPIDIHGLKYKVRRNARVRMTISDFDGELECDIGSDAGARSADEFVSNIPFHGAPSMLADSTEALEDRLWYSDPSAHFELYYIPNSFGDFGWNLVRDYLEKEFEQFQSVFDFKAIQRVNYFIAPCKVPEIAWTKYRQWAIDPVTFKAYAVFNQRDKSVTGIPTNMDQIYRNRGYAPMLLVEGAARGFEFNHYYAKRLRWKGKLPNIFRYWKTIDYRNAADSSLPVAAASFVNYMIGTRGMPKFYQLYSMADDFNADSALYAVYGEKRGALEREWHHFLDTMRVRPHMVRYFLSRSKMLGRNDESIDLMKTLIQVDTVDVTGMYDDLGLLYFLEGDYDKALDALHSARERASGRGRRVQMENSALFFSGQMDSARAAYRAYLADTTESHSLAAVKVMYAWLELTAGNDKRADSVLATVDSSRMILEVDRMEANLLGGRIRRAEGHDHEADSLFRQALARAQRLLSARPNTADLYMRAGEAYVGLGEPDTALTYLNMADFLEYRPYYVGRILIAMGNAYDLLGMRDFALKYYNIVLDSKSSYPSKVAARRYIKTPFKGPGA